MKSIKERFEAVLKKYAFENEKHINLSNVENINLADYFDATERYDLEVALEEEFFDEEDIIPDGFYSKAVDLINFIKIESALLEEEKEETGEDLNIDVIKIAVFSGKGIQEIEVSSQDKIKKILKIIYKVEKDGNS